ncbi:hypothetical protein JYQ62_24320 [Nostoc sp. UHCC 0702]|nr:hypothetical protein JYQ62_24320 [Nostoc sp. UHCC 0702]
MFALPTASSGQISDNRTTAKKNPPASVSQPGELIIRVHLPINCSHYQQHLPDKSLIIALQRKKIPQPVLASQGS